MQEEQNTPTMKESTTKVVKERIPGMFRKLARESMAEAGIRSEYKTDRDFNRKTDSYIEEIQTNLLGKGKLNIEGEDSEFIDVLLCTSAAKANREKWVEEIGDKPIDELRLAALLVIDEAEDEGSKHTGLWEDAGKLRKNLGTLKPEVMAESEKNIDNWGESKDRTPLQKLAYKEWKRRWVLIKHYNEKLQLSEDWPEIPKKEVEEEEKKLPFKLRFIKTCLGEKGLKRHCEKNNIEYTSPEGEKEEEEVFEEFELSRGLASLLESEDQLRWRRARTETLKEKLLKQIEGQTGEKAVEEVSGKEETSEGEAPETEKQEVEEVEEETPEEEKQRANKEETKLSTKEQEALEVWGRMIETLEGVDAEDLSTFIEALNQMSKISKEWKEKSKQIELEEESHDLDEKVKKAVEEAHEWTKMGEEQRDVPGAKKLLEDLARGKITFEGLGEQMFPGKARKDKRRRDEFYKSFRNGMLQAGRFSESELKDLQGKDFGEVETIFKNAIKSVINKDERLKDNKDLRKFRFKRFIFYALENMWDEIKKSITEGMGEATQ